MGAWIETVPVIVIHTALVVAPRVGAWIETSLQVFEVIENMSRPAWARGLKHERETRNPLVGEGRAPRGRVD